MNGMFDFIFENYIFLIALAVFIGRFILQAKMRGPKDRPQNQRPAVSPGQKKGPASGLPKEGRKPPAPKRPVSPPERKPEPAAVSPPVSVSPALPGEKAAGAENPADLPAASFASRLDALPPLSRAVVMAEVLGPPRGA
jgi:hypothetical protein